MLRICVMLGIVAASTVASASGGGRIEVVRDHVRVVAETARKEPARGGEESWAKEVDTWEKAAQPIVEKVALAVEKDVVAQHVKKLPLVAKGFGANTLGDLSAEGIARGYDGVTGWRLTVELDTFPPGAARATATFVLKTRPSKADVRALARDTKHAVLRALGKPVPAKVTYRAYWLAADPAAPALVLATVPLGELPALLQKSPWRSMSLESFRDAPLLVLTTKQQKFVTKNGAGHLLAHATAARLEANGDLAIQVNGTFHPAAKVQKATKADAVRLLNKPLDPALAPEDAKAATDDVEFLESLAPDIVD